MALVALVGTPILGTPLAALFLVATGGLVLLRPLDAGRDIIRFLPLLALPLLAIFSTLWSDAPERTLRAGLQILLTMAAAIVICRRISAETLIIILFVAVVAACFTAIPNIPRAFTAHVPLIGPYASKNAMAYAAHLLFALSLAIACERTRSAWWRVAACAMIPVAFILVYLAQSAGAVLAFAITLLAFPTLMLIGRVNGSSRVVILIVSLFGIAVAIFMLPGLEAAATDFRQNVLHKDTTLTGRTYLWEFAYRLAAERPMLGHGYYAFWRQGNIDAEGLWRYAGIASRSGFNFHNTFIEMRVDMGWVGICLLVATCGIILGQALLRQFTRPSTGLAFLLALTVEELVRSFAETSLFSPFSYYTLLLMATGIYAVSEISKPVGSAGFPVEKRLSRHRAIAR